MAYYTYEGGKYATDKNASADNVRSISPSTVGRQAFPRFSSVNEKTGTARIASPVGIVKSFMKSEGAKYETTEGTEERSGKTRTPRRSSFQ
jgi:hypothetical protein